MVISSGEAFLLMMKQVPGAVLVGAASQGSSGNPQPYDLRNGVTVFCHRGKIMTPDGQEIEGVGIAPDIAVAATPDDFKNADPVLEAALRPSSRVAEGVTGRGPTLLPGPDHAPTWTALAALQIPYFDLFNNVKISNSPLASTAFNDPDPGPRDARPLRRWRTPARRAFRSGFVRRMRTGSLYW